jgi:hypothetical protein
VAAYGLNPLDRPAPAAEVAAASVDDGELRIGLCLTKRSVACVNLDISRKVVEFAGGRFDEAWVPFYREQHKRLSTAGAVKQPGFLISHLRTPPHRHTLRRRTRRVRHARGRESRSARSGRAGFGERRRPCSPVAAVLALDMKQAHASEAEAGAFRIVLVAARTAWHAASVGLAGRKGSPDDHSDPRGRTWRRPKLARRWPMRRTVYRPVSGA